jgi:hypothetical protein
LGRKKEGNKLQEGKESNKLLERRGIKGFYCGVEIFCCNYAVIYCILNCDFGYFL